MEFQDIERHYLDRRQTYIKRMTFRSGSEADAEDIVQEAYYRALKYHKSCIDGAEDKWFSRILNNCLRDYKNAQMGHPVEEPDNEETDSISCPHYPEQIMREVLQRINRKDGVQREVLKLHFEQDYSPIDISRITDYTYAQCHQIIHRFREELKRLYK